jgi:hypothetical protein
MIYISKLVVSCLDHHKSYWIHSFSVLKLEHMTVVLAGYHSYISLYGNKCVSLVDRRLCIVTVWGTSPASAIFSNPYAVWSLLWDLISKESCVQDTSKVHEMLWVKMQTYWIVQFEILFFCSHSANIQTSICLSSFAPSYLCHATDLWCSFVLKFYYSCRRKV